MLALLKFSLLLILLLLLLAVMFFVAPFAAIYMACNHIALKIVSSIYTAVIQLKKE